MRERPILFSGAMVRALLAGTKTQTRRVCKAAEATALSYVVEVPDPAERGQVYNGSTFGDEDGEVQFACPYGGRGELLWVRESGAMHPLLAPEDPVQPMLFRHDVPAAADIGHYWVQRTRAPGASYSTECTREQFLQHPYAKVVPSIHMPRWACRLVLENTEVRVQHLQDISEADALAEGIVQLRDGGYGLPDGEHYHFTDPRISYWSLWEAINGPGSVDANPWVWAVSFRRIGGTHA